MRNKAITSALMLASLAASGMAFAEDATIEKISAVQSETILLKAETEREEYIQKLKKLREPPKAVEEKPAVSATDPMGMGPRGYGNPSLPGYMGQMQPQAPAPVLPPVEPKVEPPLLRGVVGSGSKLFATMAFASGEEIEAGAGDTLPGGFVVDQVTLSRVVLTDKKGKRIVVLKSTGSGIPAPSAENQGSRGLNGAQLFGGGK
jgi:type IV pilus biogenesis protein PilP